MVQHDPFRHIFNYLNLEENLHQIPYIQRKIPEIQRIFYSAQFESYDYSDRLFQSAYLIAYYPLYIDPVNDTLNEIRQRYDLNSICCQNSKTERKEIDISVFGGGAEPELLGLLRHIKHHCPSIDLVRSHYFDHHQWDEFREFSQRNMIQDYWNRHYVSGETINLNLCNLFQNQRAMELVTNSDINIMQNCATDLMFTLRGVNNYIEYMCNFFDNMKNGAILIGIDVPLFNIPLPTNPSETIDVRSSFQKITRRIRSNDRGEVIKSPSIGQPREIIPDIVRDHQMLSRFSLKTTVKFHSFIIRKVG